MGMRGLSSVLKSKGHNVKSIFLNTKTGNVNKRIRTQLLEICNDSDIICISLMTKDFKRSVGLTNFLKKHFKNKPVAWGGIHPTLCPEESIKYADIVCRGDGEEFLVELVDRLEKGNDITSTAGGWFRKGSKVIKNEVRSISQNLDEYPIPDYDHKDKWLVEDGDLIPMTHEHQKEEFKNKFLMLKDGKPSYCYVTQASRGCPHRCSYCSNAMFLEIFKGKGKVLRRKSVDYVIKEINQVRKMFPSINAVNFYDDTFFSTTDEEIVKFAKAYKKEVGIPFFCLASPLTLSESKIKALVSAGMGHIQLGIQSGSERINKEIYKRHVPNKLTLEKIRLLNKYKDKITPSYDFIVDNPYETSNDLLETIRFIYQVPKPYRVQLFSLVFYPHTGLYDMALKDGILDKKMSGYEKSLSKLANKGTMNFYAFAILYSPFIPKLIYKFFTFKPIFVVLNSRPFNIVFEYVSRAAVYLNSKLMISKNVVNR